MLERRKHKHKHRIEKKFLEKVESKPYKNLNVSKIARLRAHSDNSNTSDGSKRILKVKNKDKKSAAFEKDYITILGLEVDE